MKKFFFTLSLLVLCSACTAYTPEQTAIRPESLINSSGEKIAFPITDAASIDTIANWIKGDSPSNAELYCTPNNSCDRVKKILRAKHIPFEVQESQDETSTISLTYNRIVAHECTGGFGCATAVNSLRMVTNREQFTNPPLSGYHDAESAVKAVGGLK